jgi:hypothetical protein
VREVDGGQNDSAARESEQEMSGPVLQRARLQDSFPRMKEYQAVILRLTRHSRDDEDALTDLLNERSRGGWAPSMMAQDGLRITIVFARDTDLER